MLRTLCQDDCAIAIFIEAFFVNAATKVIYFSLESGFNRFAKFVVINRMSPGFPGKPFCFKNTHWLTSCNHKYSTKCYVISSSYCYGIPKNVIFRLCEQLRRYFAKPEKLSKR